MRSRGAVCGLLLYRQREAWTFTRLTKLFAIPNRVLSLIKAVTKTPSQLLKMHSAVAFICETLSLGCAQADLYTRVGSTLQIYF